MRALVLIIILFNSLGCGLRKTDQNGNPLPHYNVEIIGYLHNPNTMMSNDITVGIVYINGKRFYCNDNAHNGFTLGPQVPDNQAVTNNASSR